MDLGRRVAEVPPVEVDSEVVVPPVVVVSGTLSVEVVAGVVVSASVLADVPAEAGVDTDVGASAVVVKGECVSVGVVCTVVLCGTVVAEVPSVEVGSGVVVPARVVTGGAVSVGAEADVLESATV